MAVVQSKPVPKSISRKDFTTVCTSDIKCNQIMHEGVDSCVIAAYIMASGAAKGTAQFFVPIYLAQLALRVKRSGMNKETLKGVAVGFFRSIVFGTGMATGFITSSCILRRLLGIYNFYTCVMAPAAVGGLAIFFDDPKRRAIVLNTFYNLALEYLILTNKLRLPRLQETSLFMLINAVLMYQLKTANDRSGIYWFFMPPRSSVRFLGNSCPHAGPCWMDIVKGGAKFAALAVALQSLKIFLSMGLSILKNPKKAKQKLFSKATVKLAISLGGYVIIYKTVSCLLCRRFGADHPSFSAIAGLLAGSVYAVEPRLQALCSAVVAILTLLPRRASEKSFLRRAPFGELIMALCTGILFHARCMDAENCPSFVVTMMDTASNKRSLEIYGVFLDLYHQAIKDELIEDPNKKETST